MQRQKFIRTTFEWIFKEKRMAELQNVIIPLNPFIATRKRNKIKILENENTIVEKNWWRGGEDLSLLEEDTISQKCFGQKWWF